jgi:phenylacetate-CoA ligase
MNITGTLIRQAAFPAMERLKHNRIRADLTELLASERRTPEELRALQTAKLQKLLAHAVRHVKAYRSYGDLLPWIESDPARAMAQLPILTKADFRERRDDFLADGADTSALILNRSGGSTGQPVTFYMDRHTVEYSEAARWRGLTWWGIRIGDPYVMLWGSPIELSQQQLRRYRLYERWFKNRIVIPAFDLNAAQIGAYIEKMESFRPDYLYIWPSTLELFIKLMREKGHRPRVRLKAIVSTAETLHPHQRRLFEETFACPVVNEYGAREGGILAYECPEGRLHATVENSWIEVLDLATGEPALPGVPGKLVVTDLNNFVMPRLRYQLGDVIATSAERCPCGRGLPVLQSLEGREDDTFVTTDGRYVNGQYFTNIARTLGSIAQFQIVQTARDAITLKLVDHPGLTDVDVQAFREAILQHMGPVRLTMERLPEIPVSGSGKFRVAIREFPL